MDLKYFYYISESKVQMLSAQFARTNINFEINPKVEFAGLSVGVGYKSENLERENKLVSETISLLKGLRKKKTIQAVTQNNIADDSTFLLEDTGNWHHGLSEIREIEESSRVKEIRRLTYVAWKRSGRTIYLLVGAPTNVLGEKTIETSYVIHGSTVSRIRDMQFIRVSRQDVFEKIVSGLEENELAQGEKYFINSRYELSALERENSDWARGTHTGKYSGAKKFFIYNSDSDHVTLHKNANYRGEVINMFCNEVLVYLPVIRLNTVFKVFHQLPVVSAEIDTVYLGSPLYTAIC